MPSSYKTPGVYIEEIPKFPPSVAAVETAIPAFIGYTEKALDEKGDPVTTYPYVRRITSLLEYELAFGKANTVSYDIKVEQKKIGDKIIGTKCYLLGPVPTQTPATGGTDGNNPSTDSNNASVVTPDTLSERVPVHKLYYSMQLFFANGGGPCYVVSIGDYESEYVVDDFKNAINSLKAYDEPTMLVAPDAYKDNSDTYGNIIDEALKLCSKMQDRFTIIDVPNALPGGIAENSTINSNFREKIANDLAYIKYGAAYFPYLKSSLPFSLDESKVKIQEHSIIDETGAASVGAITPNTSIDGTFKNDFNAIYHSVKDFLNQRTVVLPPSGAIAGIYARVDNDRGVWKAPANVGISNVIGPALHITNDLNDTLNIDPTSGKSVNAIRSFTGKGTLVWGARTLAGNDNEWRYISVRRFFNFVEESVKKATERFVFEANDANTWMKVKAMIENFLIIQWRNGALAGAKADHAFYVRVGLPETMTAVNILEGYMYVEIGMAVVRPAEFIVLQFSHKMQES